METLDRECNLFGDYVHLLKSRVVKTCLILYLVAMNKLHLLSIEARHVLSHSAAYQVCHLKQKQGSVTIKAAVTKYRVEILQNAAVNDKVGHNFCSSSFVVFMTSVTEL